MDNSLVEMDERMEVKDRNGLSHKVARLPQMASGQPRQHFIRVLPDHIQQGQGFGQIALNAGIELKDGGAFFKGLTQTFIQTLHEIDHGRMAHGFLSGKRKPTRWAAWGGWVDWGKG